MVETREENGVVVSLDDRTCLVRLFPKEGEEKKCEQCGLCKAAVEHDRLLRAPLPPDVREGEHVRVIIRQPNPALIALLLFGVPLVALIVGGVAGWYAALYAGFPEWTGVCGGIALGLGGCYFLIRGLDRYWKNKKMLNIDIKRADAGEALQQEWSC